MAFLQVPQSIIEENVFNALKEDIGDGDITAELIPHDAISLATVSPPNPESKIPIGLLFFIVFPL